MKIFKLLGTKKAASLGLALTLGVTMLTGCGGGKKAAPGGGGAGAGKPLFIGLTNAPSGFNPLLAPDIVAQITNRFMYDTLVGQPEPNKFTPHLADSIETKDKQTYTIKLNPKAKWTDGKPVTADDVVFTFNLIANPKVETSRGGYIMMLEGVDNNGKLKNEGTITGLKALDATTVQFKCKRPVDPNFVKGLLGFNVPIVPKHVFSTIEPSKLSSSPKVTQPSVTCGPYKYVKYVTNDHLEMAANDAYFRGAPKIKKVFMKIQNGTNLVVDLKAGKIQMAAGGGIGVVPIKDIETLKSDSKLVVEGYPATAAQFMEINNQNPAFNVHFRRAMTMAIDRQKLVDQLYKGYAKIFPTLYTAASPVYDASVKPLPYDPEGAKKELAQSGYDVSKELVLQVPIGNILREQSADLIQQNLQAIGLKVKTQKYDFPTILSNARKGNYELLLLGLNCAIDPDYLTYYLKGSASDFSLTDDAKLNDLFAKGSSLTSFEERKPVYGEIQKYMRDMQFNTTLYAQDYFKAQSKNLVGGVKPYWEGSFDDMHTWYFK